MTCKYFTKPGDCDAPDGACRECNTYNKNAAMRRDFDEDEFCRNVSEDFEPEVFND